MAKGKFSNPRPYREEERQIEHSYRQLTGQEPPAPNVPSQGQEPSLFPEDGESLFTDTPQETPLSGAQGRRYADPSQGGLYAAPGQEPLPPEEDEEPDFIDKLQALWARFLAFYQKNQKLVLAGVCAGALVLIVAIAAIFFISSSDPYDNKILNNVLIADVLVGGMTKDEAITAVTAALSDSYATEDMVVDLDGTILTLSPADTGVELDVKAAVNAAYSYGRTGTSAEKEQAYQASLTGNYTVALLPYLSLDESAVRQVLEDYASDTGSTLTQASYVLEGEIPELSTDVFDESADPLTLVITMGTPGIQFDVDEVYDQILDAYSLHSFRVTVTDLEPAVEPDEVDLEAIYEEVCVEPVDASVDMSTYEAVPGSYGYTFDLEAAQALIDGADYGQEVRITLDYVAPEVLEDEVFFQDVLAEAKTPHTSNENRNTNLRLACEALDGLVLNPGETFSFNDTLGQRTTEKGYKAAPAYSGDELVDSIGGGICQVSSTLYYCTLLADLETVYRVNHGFPVSYIDYGMDATVSWGSPDFKFKNSSSYPIKIQAEVADGYVHIQILGTEERDYYVEMEYVITSILYPDTEYEYYSYDNAEGYEDGDVIESGTTGYYVKTYKVKYDRETGAQISREFEANSQYKTVNRVVASVEAAPTEATEAPTTEATTPTTEATEAPTEATEATSATEASESTESTEASAASADE